MAVIKAKKKPVIQKGTNFSYNPATFLKEHKMENSYGTDKAEDVFRLIKPFEFVGRKFLVLDTEDHPINIKNHAMPYNVVRRWVGKGKQQHPVDLPFCMSFCDGINMVTLYDSLENGYAELRKMAVWLEDPTIEKIFHNTKFDMHMLFNVGIRMLGRLHDTVVLAKLVNENRYSFQLKDIAEKSKTGIVKFEYMVDGYKKAHKVSDYRSIPRELMTEYANADVWNCFVVFTGEYPMLIEDELEPLYNNEMELMIVLWVEERLGMRINKEYEQPLKQELQKIMDDAERAVYDAVGYTFNMNSGQQIHKALLHMGVDDSIFKYTDKGNIKLDAKELERLIVVHNVDLLVRIQEYRKNEKLFGTYAVGIYDQMDSVDKVHSSINQTEATTGRMSITKPALQTLPKRDKRIRKAFIPSPGFKLWFMDLDQIEYRGFAHYAQASDLIEAIKNGYDIHQATAALIYNKPYEEVTEEERSRAKTINFGLIYGQGDDLTAASLKMTKQDARRFKEHYFAMIPEAQPFIQTVHKVIRVKGYVRNWYGRRRRLLYDEAYKGPNALIQGWAADYIKHKMVLIYKFIMAHEYKTRMINVVHDELIYEGHEDELSILPKLRWLQSDFSMYRVPITAGAEYGSPSWGEKVKPDDIGFEALTPEEMEKTLAFNVFDGSFYDLVK
jgi:DNA polymerase-1